VSIPLLLLLFAKHSSCLLLRWQPCYAPDYCYCSTHTALPLMLLCKCNDILTAAAVADIPAMLAGTGCHGYGRQLLLLLLCSNTSICICR
jgi:hypothetical protein